jgi:putative thioredoxin
MSATPTSPIIDVDDANFEREVLERSREVPVVVDFWADWCAPCKQLAPMLEGLAEEYGGRFVLARCEAEKAEGAAQGFGVRSIPAVFAVRDGRIVDSFVGVLPPDALRAFLDALMPTPAEDLARRAAALEPDDPAGAEALYREAMALDPRDARPRIGLGRALLAQGRVEEARDEVRALEARGFLEPEAETLKAEVTLRLGAREAGPLAQARAEAEAHPDDLAARLRLAEALAAGGSHAEALEIALDLVERDRRGVGEDARKLMLAVFGVLPPDSELAAEFRRRLSLVL